MIEPRLPHRPKEAVPVVVDGPLSAASFAWQLRPPQPARVVVVKCTLAIVPDGVASPIADQPFPCGDLPFEDGAESSRYASDFAPFKPRADVLLVGHAHPRSAGATTVHVQLVFGSLHRTLAAVGDRAWDGAAPSPPRPFDRIPLRHERAFGGPGFDPNPIGVGVGGVRLPNLEQPERMIRSKNDRPAPACFAPIPATFTARTSKLGKYDAAWVRERWPYFPRDFDWSYFNAAPAEQQIPPPRGDEAFSLSGVSATLPVVRGQLPGLAPRAFAIAAETRALREIPLRLDTVWFDADAMQIALVWRGALEVSSESAPEVAALFVCADTIGTPSDTARAEQRLAARLRELYPAPEVAAQAANAEAAAPAENAEPPAPPPPKTRAEIDALLASGAPLDGADLARCDLSGLDLAGRSLRGARLSRALLDAASFRGADLTGAVLAGAAGRRAIFEGASLSGANLAGAALAEADLASAKLEGASLVDADLTRASFRGATLDNASLADATLTAAVFDGASAKGADFSGALLEGASFKAAVLDDASMYDARADGCCFDDATMRKFRADAARLARSTFARARAAESSFESASLAGAVFLDAELDGSVFTHADLGGAVLNRATAKGARFRHARLVKASALKANLMEANFERADLTLADLRAANLYGVETLDAKLDGAVLDLAIVAASKLA